MAHLSLHFSPFYLLRAELGINRSYRHTTEYSPLNCDSPNQISSSPLKWKSFWGLPASNPRSPACTSDHANHVAKGLTQIVSVFMLSICDTEINQSINQTARLLGSPDMAHLSLQLCAVRFFKWFTYLDACLHSFDTCPN